MFRTYSTCRGLMDLLSNTVVLPRMQLEREIQEGQFHRGHSAVVQVLAVKPSLEQ